MPTTVLIGVVILAGFVGGELVRLLGLPRVTGYILAGLLLNPAVFPLIPESFPQAMQPVVDIALAFITFAIGGSLSMEKLRQTGAGLFALTLCEAAGAFVCIFAATGLFLLLIGSGGSGMQQTAVIAAFALLMASLGAPTDPSATLAVEHQYGARGALSQAILGIAAFDDALGILIFSLGSDAAAAMMSSTAEFSFAGVLAETGYAVAGGAGLGILLGWGFNGICSRLRSFVQSEGSYMVLVLGLLCLGFGTAAYAGVDELLTTMLTGVMVTNFNPRRQMIFRMMERYTEQLIFLLFFVVSAMHIHFAFSFAVCALVFVFVAARAAGKWMGVAAGAAAAGFEASVRKYGAGGLIAQGGIVIGLALMLQSQPEFSAVAKMLLNAVMGATIVHEIIGPLFARLVLKRAGEI
ncbi:MAG TPA: cation:proton antiporter [Desulfosalsimonadaceae bacterium]|nr:cation:proton antiporter [Desulfosalsimonadaceae bacterium]